MSTFVRHLCQLGFAASGALAVFSCRFWIAFNYGTQFPVSDQWNYEFLAVYEPWREGRFQWEMLLDRCFEHIIAVQKLLHLALYHVSGEWNILAQLVMNAALYGGLAGVALWLAVRLRHPGTALAISALILTVGVLPAGYINMVWGFQTTWVLYYGFSFAALLFLAKSQRVDAWWCAAVGASVLASMCLATGIVALGLCGLVVVGRLLERGRPRGWRWRDLVAILAVLLLCGLFLSSATAYSKLAPAPGELPRRDWVEVAGGLWQVLSWPVLVLPLTYLPLLAWFVQEVRSWRERGRLSLPAAALMGGWCLAHALAIGAARGQIQSQYIDLLAFGVVANALLLIGWLQSDIGSPGRDGAQATHSRVSGWHGHFAVAWSLCMGTGLLWSSIHAIPMLSYWKNTVLARYEVVTAYRTGRDRGMLASGFRSGVLADALNHRPELVHSPILAASLSGLPVPHNQLSPRPDPALYDRVCGISPLPVAFVPWVWLAGEDAERSRMTLSVGGVKAPYVKLVWAGRNKSGATQLRLDGAEANLLKQSKQSFSQPPGWQTIFVPAGGRAVVLSGILGGPHDWLLLQAPLACSALQYWLELLGRKSPMLLASAVCGLAVFGWGARIALRFDEGGKAAVIP